MTVRRRSIALCFALLAAVVTIPAVAGPAAAGPDDAFSLSKTDNVDGEALIGEEITYTLTASGTQVSNAYLYNLSFRDVLPVGVTFGSGDPSPTAVLTDVPSTGQTTVIWENVNDLPAGSTASISYTVDTNPDFAGGTSGSGTVPVGSTVTNSAQAVASLDAFLIPDWSPTTGAFTGDFDGEAATTHVTDIIPFRVDKTGPGELLRGVHDTGFGGRSGSAGAIYTIEIENNPDYATNGVTLRDVLGPELEFLGCQNYYAPGDDNSTDVPFRESGAAADEEWAGSGPMVTEPASAGCLTPTSVDTVAAGGGLANTVVDWSIGSLAPGQVVTVTYRAGIPMRANTTTWSTSGGAPSAASLAQGRNLDNNSGPATNEMDRTTSPDPELLVDGAPVVANTATATGTYTPTGVVASDSDVEFTEAEDIIITKAMTGSLVHGTTVSTDLVITTGEYRDFTDLVVRDLLPSALCYTGTFSSNLTASGWNTTDCPGAGSGTGSVTTTRELADGGPYGTGRLELVWDQTTVPALAALASDSSITIPYTSVVRTTYRGGLAQLPGEPVLAGDEVTNEAEVSGPDFVVAEHTNDGGADPEADGGIDGDTTSARLGNALPTIDKRISAKAGPLSDASTVTGATCGSQYGSITWQDTVATGFGPGDIVCFELGATFPAQVDYENVIIEDLLPPGYEYVAGSAARVTSIDDFPGATFTPGNLRWSLGTVDNAGRDFRWVIAVRVGVPDDGEAGDIVANLQKMIHNQNGGVVFQYRDEAPAEWTEPEVDLVKGVKAVDAVDNALDRAGQGPDFDGSASGGSTSVEIQSDAAVTFRVDVTNDGNKPALNVEVWDVLPAGIGCGDVSGITDGGVCSAGIIEWTIASLAPGATVERNYVLTMPTSVVAGESWTNNAGVRTYQADTNDGTYDYFPRNNIDPSLAASENTDRADDQAFLHTAAPVVAKAQASGIAEAGNGSNGTPGTALDRATIGEIVRYDLTLSIGDGTRVVNGIFSDVLPAGMTYFEGSALFGGSVQTLAPAVTSSALDADGDRLDGGTLTTPAVGSGGLVRYTLPADYREVANGADDTVTITFYVQAASGTAGDNRDNQGVFAYEDGSGGSQPNRSTNTPRIRIVEPSPDVVKVHTVPATPVAAPGDTVTYQVTATNLAGANVSVLHDVVLVDTVPVGTTPVRSGGGLVTADGDLVASSGTSPTGTFTGTWSDTLRTITWTRVDWAPLVSIDPGVTRTFSYQAVVDDPATASGVLENTVDLTGSNLAAVDPNLADGRTYADADSDTITLPSVTFVKDIEPLPADADDRAEVTVGEPLDYDVAVTLPADTRAYDLTVFDDLPAELDFDSFGAISFDGPCEVVPGGAPLTTADIESYGPGVGASASRIAWFIGDVLADGGACTVTVAYTLHVNDTAVDTDTLVNSANVRWNGTDEIVDAAPASLPASHDAPGDTAWDNRPAADTETILVVEPQLSIDKDVTFTDGSAIGTCDLTPGNNTAGADDTDTETGLTDGCDIAAGDELRYTLTVTNTGTQDAYDTVVTDVLPAGYEPMVAPGGAVAGDGATVTGASGSTGVWNQGTRTVTWTVPAAIADAGGVLTLDLDARLVASDALVDGQDMTNTADVPLYYALPAATRAGITTGDVPTYGNDAAATRGAVFTDTVTVEVHFPELTLTKTAVDDATDARIDENFTWSIVVENTAPVASAFAVDVADTLPAGWVYVPGTALVTTPYGGPTQVDPTVVGQDLAWADVISGAQELAPGEQVVITFDSMAPSPLVAPDAATGIANTGTTNPHTNSASTNGEDASGSTSCCDAGSGAVPYADADTADAVIRRIDLSVDKAIVDPAPINYGDIVTYTIDVTNSGPDDATGVTVVDLFPAELEYISTVSTEAGVFVGATGVWNVGSVPSGTTYRLTVRMEVDAVGVITNVAAVETADQWDPDSWPGNDVAAEDDQDEVTITALDSGLGNRVWLDLDADGVQDPSEPGIPGVTIAVSWVDASSVAQVRTTTTDSDGNWNMLGLPVDTPLTVTVDPATPASPAGSGGGGTTLPGGLAPTWELADNPVITDPQAGNGHTTGLDHETTGVVLTAGQTSYLDVDFGYVGINSLGDEVWFDVDGGGESTPEAGDRPLSGVDVTVTWAGFDDEFGTADDLVFTDTTDAGGLYLVDGLPDGRYRVVVDATDLPAGSTPTFDLDGTTTAHDSGIVSLGLGGVAPEDRRDVDFAVTGTGSLGDRVWLDIDRDGVLDANEVGLGGVRVVATYTLPTGSVTLETTTAPDGTYLFENLPLDLAIEVTVDDTTLPAGVAQTFDLDGTGTAHVATATLTSSAPDRRDVDFGYAGDGRIGDTVWFDVDGSGTSTPDAGEPGLRGVTVTLTWTNPTGGADMVLITTTDADGGYLFEHLPAGDYTVSLAGVPAGMVPTYDVDGGADLTSALTLPASGENLDQDFSFTGTGSLGDLVWHDVDADGVVDPGEEPLAGVTVVVTWTDPGSGTTYTWTEITDAAGIYGVDRLPAGTYTVTVLGATIPEGFAPTYDLDGEDDHTATLTLGVGDDRLDVDFGYRIEVDLAITKSHTGDFRVGEENTWRISVANDGPGTAAAPVTVTDDLPDGIDFVEAIGPWDCDERSGRVTCVLTDRGGTPTSLASGASRTLDLVVVATIEAAPGVVNTASVTTPTPEIDPTNNTDDDPTGIPLAVLVIDKALEGTLRSGAEVTYVLTVTNEGPSPTNGRITVVDDLPDSLEFVRTVADAGVTCDVDGQLVSCHTDDVLEVDEQLVIEIDVEVAGATGSSITNVATVVGGNVVDGEPLDPQVLASAGNEPDDSVSAVVGSGSALPFTGSNSVTAAWLAGALMLVGLALLGLRRRLAPAG
jgi:large repetitive protein